MDIVFIEDLRIETVIGIYDWERGIRQTVALDVEMAFDNRVPAASDDIAHTLDYDFVRELIAQAVGRQHHELQETLCDAVLAAVLRRPEVQAARVATRKPDVYADSASVGVERVAVKPW